jgi:hypothetical protein
MDGRHQGPLLGRNGLPQRFRPLALVCAPAGQHWGPQHSEILQSWALQSLSLPMLCKAISSQLTACCSTHRATVAFQFLSKLAGKLLRKAQPLGWVACLCVPDHRQMAGGWQKAAKAMEKQVLELLQYRLLRENLKQSWRGALPMAAHHKQAPHSNRSRPSFKMTPKSPKGTNSPVFTLGLTGSVGQICKHQCPDAPDSFPCNLVSNTTTPSVLPCL